jgi:hypothetical protein
MPSWIKVMIMLLAFIISLILFGISISNIIDMAKPKVINSEVNWKSTPLINQVSALESQNQLTYDQFEKMIRSMSSSATSQSLALQVKSFNISPQVRELPLSDQNIIIRSKLSDWKLEQALSYILKTAESNESLIFQLGFWLYSLLIWTLTISWSYIIKFFTDLLLRKICH